MFNAIKVTVLLALFAGASAFTTNTPNVSSNETSIDAKKQVFNLQLAKIAGTTNLSITWNATTSGPYQVRIGDITAPPFQVVANFFTPNTFAQQNNLVAGRTYRVRVSNNFGQVEADITM